MPAADKLLSPPVQPVPAQIAPKPPKTALVAPPAKPVETPAQSDATSNQNAPATTVASGTPAETTGNENAATTPPPAQAAEQPAQGHTYGAQNRNARVVLRMRQPVRILVQGPDGTVLINRLLNAGDSYMVPNLVGTTLTTTNAGAVEVDLDGVAMGMAGKEQQVVEILSLDPQAVADRYNGG